MDWCSKSESTDIKQSVIWSLKSYNTEIKQSVIWSSKSLNTDKGYLQIIQYLCEAQKVKTQINIV